MTLSLRGLRGVSISSNGMAYELHDAGIPGPSVRHLHHPRHHHVPQAPHAPPMLLHSNADPHTPNHAHARPPSHPHSQSSVAYTTSTPSSRLPPAPTRTAADLMRVGSRDFDVIRKLGDGSFGTVFLANWKSPLPSDMVPSIMHTTRSHEFRGKRLVAIKRMKKPYASWNDCLRLRELRSLLEIPHHPNIVALYDAFLMPSTSQLHFVFESLEGNLYQLAKVRRERNFPPGLIASVFKQTLEGLAHVHAYGFFHRDMKPENLLLTTLGLVDYPDPTRPGVFITDVSVVVKIADFGLARELSSRPPYSTYVSTRWYRAPEMLLRATNYSAPVDLWALGAIITEMVNLEPLWPGVNDSAQLMLISETLGSPSDEWGLDPRTGKPVGGGPWPDAQLLMHRDGVAWPRSPPEEFSTKFSTKMPTNLIYLIQDLLRYDPAARPTAAESLRSPFMLEDAVKLQPLTITAAQHASASDPPPGSVGSVSTAASSNVLAPIHLSHSHVAHAPSVQPERSLAPSLSQALPLPAYIGASQAGAIGHVPNDLFGSAEHLHADTGYAASVGTTNSAASALHLFSSPRDVPYLGSSSYLASDPHPAASRTQLHHDGHALHSPKEPPLPEDLGDDLGEGDPRKVKGQGRARALLSRRHMGLRYEESQELQSISLSPSLPLIGEAQDPSESDPQGRHSLNPHPNLGTSLHDPTWVPQPVEELVTVLDSPSPEAEDELALGSSSPALSNASGSSTGTTNIAFAAAGTAMAPSPEPDGLGRVHAQDSSYTGGSYQHGYRGNSFASVQMGRSDPFLAAGSNQTLGAPVDLGSAPLGSTACASGARDHRTFSPSSSAVLSHVRSPRTGTATSAGSLSSFDQVSAYSHYSRFSTLSGPMAGPFSGVAPTRLRCARAPSTQSSVDSQLLNDLSNMLGANVQNSPALNPRPLRNISRASDGSRRSRSQGRTRSRNVSFSSRSGLPSSPLLAHVTHRVHPYRSSSRPLSNPTARPSSLGGSVPPIPSNPTPPQ